MRTGIANLPLHSGHTPRWLFERMKKLSREIVRIVVEEFGRDEFLRRISDPFWFQGFSCVIGFDWHSSGTTTVTGGVLKESISPEELGIAVAGGKGKASRKTPEEIERFGEVLSLSTKKTENLKYASRMAAKVDNAALQDGYQLYHHVFIFTEEGKWCVIQQGMNPENRYARRYHWLSDNVKSFVNEPHSAICCDAKTKVLNMVAAESENARKASVDLVKDNPIHLKKYLTGQRTLFNYGFTMPRKHYIDLKNFKPLMNAYEFQPKNYEELLMVKGMGPKTIRALALLSDLIYGAEPSWRDPVKYSFAHGGKDRTPYPVDRKTMDKSIEILRTAVEEARVGNKEKLHALKRLKEFIPKYEYGERSS